MSGNGVEIYDRIIRLKFLSRVFPISPHAWFSIELVEMKCAESASWERKTEMEWNSFPICGCRRDRTETTINDLPPTKYKHLIKLLEKLNTTQVKKTLWTTKNEILSEKLCFVICMMPDARWKIVKPKSYFLCGFSGLLRLYQNKKKEKWSTKRPSEDITQLTRCTNWTERNKKRWNKI